MHIFEVLYSERKDGNEEQEEVLGRGCKCSEGNYCCSFLFLSWSVCFRVNY